MSRPTVYLAGPIAGLTYVDAQNWRDIVRDLLSPQVEAFSPLRGKEFLRHRGIIEDGEWDNAMASDRGIMTRDHRDVMTCDLVFCNLTGAPDRVSIGTVMEIAWAHAYRKPLVVVMERVRNAHEHPMIREAISYRTESLVEAVAITKSVLLARPAERPECQAGCTAEPFNRPGETAAIAKMADVTMPAPGSKEDFAMQIGRIKGRM